MHKWHMDKKIPGVKLNFRKVQNRVWCILGAPAGNRIPAGWTASVQTRMRKERQRPAASAAYALSGLSPASLETRGPPPDSPDLIILKWKMHLGPLDHHHH